MVAAGPAGGARAGGACTGPSMLPHTAMPTHFSLSSRRAVERAAAQPPAWLCLAAAATMDGGREGDEGVEFLHFGDSITLFDIDHRGYLMSHMSG